VQVRTSVAVILAVAAVWVLSSCGGGSISTPSARAALQSAGFDDIVVLRDQGMEEPTFDEVDLRGNGPQGSAPFFGPLRLTRFHSAKEAKLAYWGDQSRPALSQIIYNQHLHPTPAYGERRFEFPRGFQLRKVLSFRICNVLLFSYNARLDPRLTAKVNRAARALRAKCH
jgi:hypothetical protein